jgi:hypothetical protein
VKRYQFAYQDVGFLDFYVEYPLIVEAFALNHFSVMDSDTKKNGVQYLSNNKLYYLVIKAFGHDNQN